MVEKIKAVDNENQKTEVDLLIEEIILSSADRIIQTSKEIAQEIVSKVMAEIASQRTKYVPNPRTFTDVKKNVSYLIKHGGEKPLQILSAATIDIDELARNEDPSAIELKVLIKIMEEFCPDVSLLKSILPKENGSNDNPSLLVQKFLANLKVKSKATKQTLFVKNMDLLIKDQQAPLIELLIRHLSSISTINVIIFHEQEIEFYKKNGDESWQGLEPGSGDAIFEKLTPQI